MTVSNPRAAQSVRPRLSNLAPVADPPEWRIGAFGECRGLANHSLSPLPLFPPVEFFCLSLGMRRELAPFGAADGSRG